MGPLLSSWPTARAVERRATACAMAALAVVVTATAATASRADAYGYSVVGPGVEVMDSRDFLSPMRMVHTLHHDGKDVLIHVEVLTGPYAVPTPVPVRIWTDSTATLPPLTVDICSDDNCYDILATEHVEVHSQTSKIPELATNVVTTTVFPDAEVIYSQVRELTPRNMRQSRAQVKVLDSERVVALVGNHEQDLLSATLQVSGITHGTLGIRGVRTGNQLNATPYLTHAFDAVVVDLNAPLTPELQATLRTFALEGGTVVTPSHFVPADLDDAGQWSPVKFRGPMLKFRGELVVSPQPRKHNIRFADYGAGKWVRLDEHLSGENLTATLLSVDARFAVMRGEPYHRSRPDSVAAKIAVHRLHGGGIAGALGFLWVLSLFMLFLALRQRGIRTILVGLGGASVVATGLFLTGAALWRGTGSQATFTVFERELGDEVAIEMGTSAQRSTDLASTVALRAPANIPVAHSRTAPEARLHVATGTRGAENVVKMRSEVDETLAVHWRRAVTTPAPVEVELSGDDVIVTNTSDNALTVVGILAHDDMRWSKSVAAGDKAVHSTLERYREFGRFNLGLAAGRMAHELETACRNAGRLQPETFVCVMTLDLSNPDDVVAHHIVGLRQRGAK